MWNQQHPPDLGMTLGRLLERSETMVEQMTDIRSRLVDGEKRFQTIEKQIATFEAKKAEPIPGLEKAIKAAVPYIIGLLVLIVTGKADLALQIMQGGGK